MERPPTSSSGSSTSISGTQAAARAAGERSRELQNRGWLASERNSYTTGHVLTIDGGLTATF